MKFQIYIFLAMTAFITSVLPLNSQAAEEKKDKKAESEKKENMDKNANKTVTTDSGLQYIDLVVGTGESPKQGQTVKVHYTGWLENGKKI